VTLKITAGEVVVVVGENGSGKSTLLNLLPRYYDPDRGAVQIDDIDIRHVRLRDLRSQIGVVTQETLLFDDTIYENIRYGKSDATPAEVHSAAEKAHVTQLFDQLPEGFETRVGPRGSRLSGGQRQRVALARALLRDPSILILDEATSAVDAQSESLIHQCLGEFVKGRTVFLITHSVTPQILEFATRIVVMEQGQLLATGSHEELLQTCPAYQRLYRAQTFGRGNDSLAEFRIDATDAGPENDASTSTDPAHVIKFSPTTSEIINHGARRKAN
jgi:subfamily B ATP-binding cassette protein MsbA